MIAAMKVGLAYVPIDISFPIERLEYIANEYQQLSGNSKNLFT